MKAASGHFNRHIAMRYGEELGLWYVIEFPKAGGTWLTHMVADFLGIPFPQHTLLPVTFKAVLQSHWKYTPGLKRVFYLVRDGRDSMVSLYYMRMRLVKRAYYQHDTKYKRQFQRLFGSNFDPDDIYSNLPRFIEQEMRHPQGGTRINWPDHVRQWWNPEHPDRYCLKYEDLLLNGFDTLLNGFQKLAPGSLDEEQLRHTIRRYEFERITGRKPGEVDNSSFFRSGTAGNWVACFSPEAIETFDHYAGQTLMDLGYYDEDKRGLLSVRENQSLRDVSN
ncbi:MULTISPECIES: sulfotransferase domain-containing protein [unclassified Thiocapsa]|uniref:sulfotransferase domain-containing protein n=1 Tax=unclassified Thiocapsa TaxID=2641286 RepID=UPI0035B3769C